MNDGIASKQDIKTLKDDELSKEYEITISSQSILFATDVEIAEAAKKFKLAGFREGKVPLSIVKNQIGREVLSRQIDHKINQEIQRLIKEKELAIAIKPVVEIKDFDPNNALRFLIKFNLLPQVPEINFKDEQFENLEMFELKIEDSDMKRAYQNVLEATSSFVTAPNDYKAKNGDAVIVDFIGKVDGKEFEGNSAQSLRIVIGNGQFVEDLEKQLIGLKKADEVSLKVTFPKNYEMQDIAGKETVFEVKVHEVLKSDSDNKIDDKFVKEKFGVENVKEFDDLLKKKIEADFNGIVKMQLKRKLFDILEEICDFNLPEDVVDSDFTILLEEYKKNKTSIPEKTEEEETEELKKVAKRRVKIGFILADLIRRFEIQTSDDEIQNLKQIEISKNPSEASKINDFYNKAENLDRIRSSMIEDKIINYLLYEKINLKKIPITSDEFNKKLEAEQKNI